MYVRSFIVNKTRMNFFKPSECHGKIMNNSVPSSSASFCALLKLDKTKLTSSFH